MLPPPVLAGGSDHTPARLLGTAAGTLLLLLAAVVGTAGEGDLAPGRKRGAISPGHAGKGLALDDEMASEHGISINIREHATHLLISLEL